MNTARFTLAATVALLATAVARPAFLRQEMLLEEPTEQHAYLLADVGEWEGKFTTFMPGAPAEPIVATQTVDAIGGFWTQTRFECEFMGSPYVGTGCLGYDAKKKKFVGTWVDSTTSFMAVTEGEFDEAKDALVMHWDAPDMTGAMAHHRSETVRTKGGHEATFYMGDGEGTKTMVIEMQRKGGAALDAASER